MGRTCPSFPKISMPIIYTYIYVCVCVCMYFRKIKGKHNVSQILNNIKSKIYSLWVLQDHFTGIQWIPQHDLAPHVCFIEVVFI